MKPERELKDGALEMLRIVFDPEATEGEVDAARITLVEIIAPDILCESLPEHLRKAVDDDVADIENGSAFMSQTEHELVDCKYCRSRDGLLLRRSSRASGSFFRMWCSNCSASSDRMSSPSLAKASWNQLHEGR